ncbi:hypothetical protein [Burkholderia sp. MSMB1826]|uniref:hypothetical protein n=1 Tax=Burkholderia sp. MSMB1826 TaxID=1637875 RepID=UPI00076C9774|nr:hypothetical protein [Burkholderia sp. MSMB1826]KVL21345.1 hypothetical protein WS95_10215 [Burkholderia sp. MSMB1826]
MEHEIDRRRIAMRSPTRARYGDARRRSRIGRLHARAFIDRIKREWEPYFDRRGRRSAPNAPGAARSARFLYKMADSMHRTTLP